MNKIIIHDRPTGQKQAELTDIIYESALNIAGWYCHGAMQRTAADVLMLFWTELNKYEKEKEVSVFIGMDGDGLKLAFSCPCLGDLWYCVTHDGVVKLDKLGHCMFNEYWRYIPANTKEVWHD